MPLDKSGKYHMNTHHAKAADKQASKPGNEPQPGPDGMAGGPSGGKDLSAGIPTPAMPAPRTNPYLDEIDAAAKNAHAQLSPGAQEALKRARAGAPVPMQHPAHEAADSMSEHMSSMDPEDLMDMKTKLESLLQEITDLLGSGAPESQAGSHPLLGGY